MYDVFKTTVSSVD